MGYRPVAVSYPIKMSNRYARSARGYEYTDILHYLPHRYPLLLTDADVNDAVVCDTEIIGAKKNLSRGPSAVNNSPLLLPSPVSSLAPE